MPTQQKIFNNRKDGLFTKLPHWKIEAIRQDKLDGLSLKDIALKYKVAKSTVSIYCRDLFDNDNRKYYTEEEIRKSVAERGKGKDHNLYKRCVDCNAIIRNRNIRCIQCSIKHQIETGEVSKFVNLGSSHRFNLKGQVKMKMPTHKHRRKRIHNYKIIWQTYKDTGYGAFRLSRILNIPRSTLSSILCKLRYGNTNKLLEG